MNVKIKNRIKRLSLFYFLFVILGLSAQVPAFGKFSHTLKNYGINEGLPSYQIYQIIQDKTGYIWFGTDRGLVKYNGSEFTVYTTENGLSNNVIFHLHENENGELWCYGNDNRIHYFYEENFYPYRYNDSLVKYFPENSDLLYFTANKDEVTISVVNFKTSSHYLKINKKGVIQENAKNGIFIKEIDQNLTVSSNQINDHVYYNDSLIYTFKGGSITNKYNDRYSKEFCYATKFDSFLYVVLTDKILKIDLNNQDQPILMDLAGKNIQNITKDSKGNIYISHNQGLTWFKNGNLNEPHELLPNYNVSNVFVDNNDVLWIATLFNGIFQLNNIEHLHFFIEDKTTYFGIFEVDEKIYLELNSNVLYELSLKQPKKIDLSLLKNERHLFLDSKHSFFTNKICRYVTFLDPENDRYFKSDYYSYKSIRFQEKTISSINNSDLEIIHENNQSNVLQFDHFLHSFDTYADFVFVATDNSIRYFNIQDIPKDKKSISIKSDSLKSFQPAVPFFQSKIVSIQNMNDSILLFSSTTKGLCMYNPSNKSTVIYSKENGLISNNIHQTYTDGNSVVASSRKGISLIRNNTIQNYAVSNGLLSNNIVNVIIKGNELWVCTDRGVSILPIGFTKKEEPRIKLKQLSVDEAPYLLKNEYNLDHSAKNLNIVYESISFYQDNNTSYQYMLEGVDEKWVETKSNQIRYPNLPSGNFNFLIKKENADKTWSRTIELFSISKPSPFWKKNWFLILAVVFIFLISFFIFALINLRQRKKQADKIKLLNLERKTLQAQINPHFIFNSLTSLQNLILKDDKRKSQAFLIQFSKLTRLALNHSTKNHISLSEEIEFLTLYMNLEKTRFLNRFNYHFSFDFEDKGIEIPPLLIQPFIENSILHGFSDFESGGELSISFQKRDQKVMICTIKDNGCGRDNSFSNSNKMSHGIKLIKERLAIIMKEQALEIIDLKEGNKPTGTAVRIFIPYKT